MVDPEFRSLSIRLLEAADRRGYDHGAAEALQVLLGALDAGDERTGAYLLMIALEVLREIRPHARRYEFQIEFRRRVEPR